MTTPDPFFDLLRKSEERERPVSALIELTHACNVDCEHCYLDLLPDKKIGALDTESWKRIFGELAAEGCVFLTLSGGEVLLRRDWFELAMHARSLGFAVRFYTNGTLVTEETADKIATVKPMDVEISLLGGIAVTHDAVSRRRGSFDKTIAGVRRLRARGINVMLKCVLMKKNVAEYEEMKALAESLDCDIFFDIEVTPKNDGSRGPTELAAEGDALMVAAREIYGLKNKAPNPASRDDRLTHTPCAAGRRTCQIGPTGDVFPCTQWTTPLGNLQKTSFRELWRENEMFKTIRAKRIASFDVCSRCELLDACSPCMALSLLEQGNLEGPSPTKCRATEMKARALGRTAEAAGFREGLFSREGADAVQPSSGLVQIRRKAG
jgi:radical SAM protein with 4Fe4S-binding SPASM domain